MTKDNSLHARQVALLFSEAPPLVISAVFVALIVAVTSYHIESGLSSFFWLTAMLLVCGIRCGLSELYRAANPATASDVEMWERRFVIGALASGIIWGLAPWLLFSHEQIMYKFFLYTILTGVAVVSIAVYSSRFVAYASLVIPMFVLTALETLRHGELLFVLGLLFCSTAIVLLRISWRYQASIVKMLLLDTEINALALRLEQQELALEVANELELRTLSALEEADIYTWATDSELRVQEISSHFSDKSGIPVQAINGGSITSFDGSLLQDSPGFNNFNMALHNRESLRDVELQFRCINGARMIVLITGKPVFDQAKEFVGFQGFIRNVTASSTTIENLRHLAQHDALTGLINHREFIARVARYVPPVNLKGRVPHVAYIDIQRLKVLNENLGIAAGDEMFCQLAQLLNNVVKEQGVAARLGGGTFGLLLDPGEIEGAIEVVEASILCLENHRYHKDGFAFSVDVRAGIVGITPQMDTAEVVLGLADRACRSVTLPSNKKYYVYHDDLMESMQAASSESLAKILSDLDADNLCLQYQPIVNLKQRAAVWFEALLATRDKNGTAILLGQRLIAAEEHGVISRFDHWALDAALFELSSHSELLDGAGVTVNISSNTICDPAFPEFVLSRLSEYAVPPQRLCIEITETLGFKDLAVARVHLEPLVRKGCKLSLDDFGTGSSSLEYLKYLPVNYLKINHVFLAGVETCEMDQIICQTIVELARRTGCEIIAESVEQSDFTAVLENLGINLAQGYALGAPNDLPVRLSGEAANHPDSHADSSSAAGDAYLPLGKTG